MANKDENSLVPTSINSLGPIHLYTQQPSYYHTQSETHRTVPEFQQIAGRVNLFKGIEDAVTEEPDLWSNSTEDKPPVFESEPGGESGGWQPANERVEQINRFLRLRFGNLAEYQTKIALAPSLKEALLWEETEKKTLEELLASDEWKVLSDGSTQVMKEYRALSTLRAAYSGLCEKEYLQDHCVIPIKYFADLLVTAPVIFMVTGDLGSMQNTFFPTASQGFLDLFELMNCKTRSLNSYGDCNGEMLPHGVSQVIAKVRNRFDWIAILTPYLHVVTRELKTQQWQRVVDPYLIGYSSQVPDQLFFLARWSNTGLLPQTEEMVANTMSFVASPDNYNLSNHGAYDPNAGFINSFLNWPTKYSNGWSRKYTKMTTIQERLRGLVRTFASGDLFSEITVR